MESSPGRGRAALSVVSDEFIAPKDGPGGHPVTAVPEQPLDPSLLGRETRIVVEGAKTSDKALVVPLSGVFSRADGSSRVTRVGADGDQELSSSVQDSLQEDSSPSRARTRSCAPVIASSSRAPVGQADEPFFTSLSFAPARTSSSLTG